MRQDDCQKLIALLDAAKTEISAAQCEIDGRKKRRVMKTPPTNGKKLEIDGKTGFHVNGKTPT